ncbi:hypothetical protein F0562_007910 [Nyssa sinensis]|uniref:Uncharacterized protein n=1 Tax=Nyssa sinensis TaxID=561372 RepID=A0A5J5A665_9ASTE|nr:hypothetical protein F0562_007910 [Nyssa sinensis]
MKRTNHSVQNKGIVLQYDPGYHKSDSSQDMIVVVVDHPEADASLEKGASCWWKMDASQCWWGQNGVIGWWSKRDATQRDGSRKWCGEDEQRMGVRVVETGELAVTGLDDEDYSNNGEYGDGQLWR